MRVHRLTRPARRRRRRAADALPAATAHAPPAQRLPLRPYQEEAILAILAAQTRGVTRPLVVLPVGAGKTIVFAHLLRQRAGRAMARQWNLHPYGARLRRDQPARVSPFDDLNGVQYHPNWLPNLLIASSMGGLRH